MALKIDPKVVSTIIDAVRRRADGATLNEVMAAFSQPPPRRTAQRWLQGLANAGILRAVTTPEPYRYFVTPLADSPASLATAMANAPSAPANPAGNMANAPTAGAIPAPLANPTPAALANPAAPNLANLPVGQPSNLPAVANVLVGHVANPPDRTDAQVGQMANAPTAGTIPAPLANPTPAALANPADPNPANPPVGQPSALPAVANGPVAHVANRPDLTDAQVGQMANARPAPSSPAGNMANAPTAGTMSAPLANPTPASPANPATPNPANPPVGQPSDLPAMANGPVGHVANRPELTDAQVGQVANARSAPASPAGNMANAPTAGTMSAPLANPTPASPANPATPNLANPPVGQPSALPAMANGPVGHVANRPDMSNAPKPAAPATPKSRKKAKPEEPAAADSAIPAVARSIEQLAQAAVSAPAKGAAAEATATKKLAEAIAALISGGRKSALGGALTASAMVLLYIMYTLTGGSGWVTLALGGSMIAAALGWRWVTAGRSNGLTVDPSNGGGAPSGSSVDRPSDTPARTVQPVDRSTVIQSGASAGDRSTVVPSARAACFRHRYLIAGLFLTGLAVAVGAALCLRIRSRPSTDAVSAWLVQKVAPLPVRVAALNLTYLPSDSAEQRMEYHARLQTTEPLFQAIETGPYLHAHFPAEMAVIDAAGKKPSQAPATLASRLATLGPAPTPAVSDLGLIAVKTASESSAFASGKVSAWRQAGTWLFGNATLALNRSELPGDRRDVLAAAKPAVFVVDPPDDAARLKTLIVEHAAYATKLQAALAALATDLQRERQENAAALARLVQRGTFFTGLVVDAPRPDSHRVLLEVTDCSATTHRLTLVLRNESGWYNTRSAEGEWSIDADDETCHAKVRFSSFGRIAGAGWPLDETTAWSLTLRVRLDGTVAVDPLGWELHRVADRDIAAAKAEFGYGGDAAKAASRITVDRSNGGSAADQPINRTSDTPAGGNVPPSGRSVDPSTGRSATDQLIDRASDSAAKAASGSSVDQSNRGSAADQRINRTSETPVRSVRTDRPLDRSTVIPATPSGRSVDQKPGGSDVARPLDGSTVIQSTPATPAWPAVATGNPGAYVLAGQWLSLPQNRPTVVRSTPQKLNNALNRLTRWEDSLAGKTSEAAPNLYGELTFDGTNYVPVVAAKDVVILYVGPLTPISADQLARYPELKTYPAIELARLKTASDGVRRAPLFTIAPEFVGFGPNRVEATVERTTVRLLDGTTGVPALLLRCTAPLARGHYALCCGPRWYELAAE